MELIAEDLRISLRKPLFRRYEIGASAGGGNGQKTVRLRVCRPLTYMNNSGSALPALMKRHALSSDRLFVVCDTLDLPPGSCRLKRKGSSAGHRGLESIIATLGTEAFWRFYIGIGRPEKKEEVVPFVLSRPSAAEEASIEGACRKTADAILGLRASRPELLMSSFNRT